MTHISQIFTITIYKLLTETQLIIYDLKTAITICWVEFAKFCATKHSNEKSPISIDQS